MLTDLHSLLVGNDCLSSSSPISIRRVPRNELLVDARKLVVIDCETTDTGLHVVSCPALIDRYIHVGQQDYWARESRIHGYLLRDHLEHCSRHFRIPHVDIKVIELNIGSTTWFLHPRCSCKERFVCLLSATIWKCY
jgi:hypothetical protein